MTDAYRVETRVGRLMEARVHALASVEEANAYSEAIRLEALRHARAPAVLCADHRPVRLYPPAVTDRLVDLFQVMNSHLERIAILVAPTNATLLLQLQRIVKEAGFDMRRVFTEVEPAMEHLSGALDARERRRARAFLEEIKAG